MAKKQLPCISCESLVDKVDAQIVDADLFPYLNQMPKGIQEGVYCPQCFAIKVSDPLNQYQNQVDRAKNVNVFFAKQSKESRFVRRTEKPLQVRECSDPDDVVMRLAFKAVEVNKNSIVDVAMTSHKVQNGKWHTTIWAGTAIPAQIDDRELQRKFLTTPN